MESQQHCAYNQTRECFLGLEVIAGDFSHARLNDWTMVLAPGSGAGLWMSPFRGISNESAGFLLDLVYLDEDCRVIEVVEFFPTFCAAPTSPAAASVLALPAHSIYSSQTQPGDQLMLCDLEEMTWRMELISRATGVAVSAPSEFGCPDSLRPVQSNLSLERRRPVPGQLLSSSSDSLTTKIDRSRKRPKIPETNGLPERNEQLNPIPELRNMTAAGSWMDRWLFPKTTDRRRSLRIPAPGLAAYFWTGGPPKAHPVRDISATGLYVVNQERWYLGTLVRMTLTSLAGEQPPAERSITLETRAVRHGNDGVGLQIMTQHTRKPRGWRPSSYGGADNEHFNQFLKHVAHLESSVC
jgi:PilZ domain